MNNRIKDILLLCLCLISISAFTQHSITGNFPPLAGQQVRLVGFEGFDIYTIDSTKVTEKGVFTLKYTDKDQGMGYLSAADNKPFFVVLSGETIKLKDYLCVNG